MPIATLLLVMWMVAQTGNITVPCGGFIHCDPIQALPTPEPGAIVCIMDHGYECANSDGKICHGLLNYPCDPSAPSEHVIEIRTKRETDGWSGWPIACDPQDETEIQRGKELWYRCVRVTKTLWIDGVRVGVIRETDEK